MQFNLKSCILCLLILIFVNLSILPQINIEKYREGGKESGFKGNFDVTLNLNTGNTKLL